MSWTRCGQLFAFALLWLGVSRSHATDTEVGIARTRPALGRYVKVDQGYMIPYKSRIPGTAIEFEMVPVPGGKFTLGSPAAEKGRKRHEGPQLVVVVKPFWIGRYEVTWGEYHHYYDLVGIFRKFKHAKIRTVTEKNRVDAVTAPSLIYEWSGRMPAVKDKRTRPRHPAVSMTQYAAKQYTKWLSRLTGEFYRLPSEVEWEYACRASSTTPFHFGKNVNKLGDYAWYAGNSSHETHRVGQKKPNSWGLYDMHGNAAEWVLDKFDKRGYTGLAKAIAADQRPIAWPNQLYPRVVRGGSWDSDPLQCRSAARLGSNKEWQIEEPSIPHSPWWLCNTDVHNRVGFRIVRPLASPALNKRSSYWDADVRKLREDVDDQISENGRGQIGLVDPKLPAAIKRIAKER